jgi:metal-dependent amidase/aminoacylase/carboxypeptidase family protein
VAYIDDLRVPANPTVTFNVGVIEGGQSVNTISGAASMLVDMRSEDKAALQAIEKQILPALQQGTDETNKRWNSAAIKVETVLIGERPGDDVIDFPDCSNRVGRIVGAGQKIRLSTVRIRPMRIYQ